MEVSKRQATLLFLLGIVAAVVACVPPRAICETTSGDASGLAKGSAPKWSVQVQRVDSSGIDLAYSFQVAIYENVLKELQDGKQFKQVFREGDREASNAGNLLVLKTIVDKYTPGNETRRAVTTVSGATKLKVRIQLLAPGGKVVLERTVNGDVHFFGSNLRATHNLARNIATEIKQSSWSVPEQTSATLTGQL